MTFPPFYSVAYDDTPSYVVNRCSNVGYSFFKNMPLTIRPKHVKFGLIPSYYFRPLS